MRDIPVDIFDEHNHIDVIAELPGMEEKDIKVELKTDTLTISAGTMELKYFKSCGFPVSPKALLKIIQKWHLGNYISKGIGLHN